MCRSMSCNIDRKFLPKFLLFCLIALSVALPSTVFGSKHRDFARKLEEKVVLPIVNNTPGAALILVVDGNIALQRAYGVREQGKDDPVTHETLFRVASISKTFASAAAAILVKEQLITWQTPVTESLETIQFKRADYGNRINLHHLLSQSTGLMPHAYTNLIEDNMPYQRIKSRLNRVDFVCEPGACYGYQNVVFSLVGDIVAATAGVDYPTYVTNKIFVPLKMDRASFGLDAFINDENHAKPHIRNGGRWSPVRTTRHYYRVAPAAGVNASIDDMKEWLLAQLGQKPVVLTPDMLDEMHGGAVKTTLHQAHYRWRKHLTNVRYGLGWRVFDYGSDTGFVHHGGYVKGMRGEMVFNPKLQTGLVFLTNCETQEVNDLVFDFLDLHQDYFRTANAGPHSTGR